MSNTNGIPVFSVEDLIKGEVYPLKINLNGVEGLVHYKSMSAATLSELSKAFKTEDSSERIENMSRRFSKIICKSDGTDLMTVEQAMQVPFELQNNILDQIAEDTKKRNGKSEEPLLGEGSEKTLSSG